MSEEKTSGGTTYTGQFASLIVGTTYDSLPAEAVIKAKAALFDCVGAAIAGAGQQTVKILVDFVHDMGGNGECSVIGGGFKTSPPYAALANGITAHVLEFDDAAGEAWSAHPSAVLLPAVLAVSEARKISGEDTILAYIIGLEVGARIGRAMREGHYEYGYVGGWQNTSTIGTMAACAAAAKALKLDVDKTRMALGIAGSLASGLNKANVGTMTKPMHAGHGSYNGVFAALLAERDFTASKNVLDGQWGFCSMFASGRECFTDRLVKGFGAPWDVISPGITFKPFPSCRATHPSIDASLQLRKQGSFKLDDIAEIICNNSVNLPEIIRYHSPQNVLEGKFSLEYTIALALVEGEVRLKHFRTDRWLKDPRVHQVMDKIKCVYPSDWEKGVNAPQEVVIKTVDGKVFSKKVAMSDTKGSPVNPMTQEELRAKFMECASLTLPPAAIEHTMELLSSLEKIANITEIMDFIRSKPV